MGPEPQREKHGTFEWVVKFVQIEKFLSPRFTGLPEQQVREELRVLVIGCGTSTLSKEVADCGYGEVVSIDNDVGCIEHMSRTFSNESSRMQWYTYDLVEHVGHPAMMDSRNTESFDIVIDKGTLDAILVEGAVCNMLSEVHRFMKPGGVYVLCSINAEDMLHTLLSSPALGFEVSVYNSVSEEVCSSADDNKGRYDLNTNPSSKAEGVVAICKKAEDAHRIIVDIEALAQQEQEALNFYFQDEVPLLTPAFEASLRERFQMASTRLGTRSLPVDVAYMVMFSDAERRAYTSDLFEEDLRKFGAVRELSYEDCVEFVRQMQ